MKVLVVKEFEVLEKKTHTEHDLPVIGLYQTHETSRKSHGSYKTKGKAEKVKQFLVDRYVASGYWKVSIESTPQTTVLYEDSVSNDIEIWVREKVVSERAVR